MTLAEITRALRQLRVSGMAATLEPRIVQAQAEHWAPLDLVAALVQDELQRRQDRLLDRRVKRAGFRDAGKTLDTFDFDFNRKLDRRLVFDLAAGHWSSPEWCVNRTHGEAPRVLHAALATLTSFDFSKDMSR